MAHWTYFLLAIVWAFSLEVESRCDHTFQLRSQNVNLFPNDNNAVQNCVKVGECVIGWKYVTKNGQKLVEYQAQAETYGYIAVGLNDHGGNWRGADIIIVTGSTATNDFHSLDCVNADQDIFRPVQDTNQEVTLGAVLQNIELRTVSFERPRYLSSGNDRNVEYGTHLLCTYGPQTNLEDLNTLTIANSNSEVLSFQWTGSSAQTLSASIMVLLLVTTITAYLNIE